MSKHIKIKPRQKYNSLELLGNIASYDFSIEILKTKGKIVGEGAVYDCFGRGPDSLLV